MAGNGVSIGNIGGVTINGVRCGLVSDVACDYVSRGFRPGIADHLTEQETRIAVKAGVLLERMRSQGYSAEDTRKAFVQKIVDEAQRVKAAPHIDPVELCKPDGMVGNPCECPLCSSEQVESNAVREG